MIATCHKDRPASYLGLCRPCYERRLRATNPAYAERQRANQRAWAARNPERIRANTERRKAKLRQDPMLRRNVYLWKQYGIAHDVYLEMLEKQGGGCAICGRAPGKFRHHVDHCHKTGRVRGILCHQCNWYIGKVERGDGLLEKIAAYLKRGEDDRYKI